MARSITRAKKSLMLVARQRINGLTSCAEGQITTSVGSLLGGDVTFPCLDHQDGTISFGGIENNFFLQV